jgi:hypothetical protein
MYVTFLGDYVSAEGNFPFRAGRTDLQGSGGVRATAPVSEIADLVDFCGPKLLAYWRFGRSVIAITEKHVCDYVIRGARATY